ncbi:MAG: carbohydrate-binding domain-containing protein [Prevotellaceae bacterium]|jgi:hypothetical protein|nr:carbohydrate-binding domain-containing protein [Prevotellaceae bacterium]
MKVNNLLMALCCLLMALIASCGKDNPGTTTGDDVDNGYDGDFTPNTQPLSLENAVSITFTDSGTIVANPFLNNGVATDISNGNVVVTSTITDKELNYILSGETAGGSVKFYGSYKFNLYLNGVSITNPQGAAVNIQCGKKISVYVVDNTSNRLIDGFTYSQVTGEDMKGTFFSEGQLNFYGTGELLIRGKCKHAICVDDYFRMYDGNVIIKEAASDAIHANDYIRIDGGTLTTKSVGEGLDCEKGYVEINGGAINITTTGDKGHGIKSATTTTVNSTGNTTVAASGKASKGFKSAGNMVITKGNVTITTTGNAFYDADEKDISSASGIKCDANLTINGGNINITSSGSGGKGISVDEKLVVNSGTINITTSGGYFNYNKDGSSAKAIKSNGNLTVNDGTITIKTSGTNAEGVESKDTLRIKGGNVEIEAYDDAMNASKHIEISGGNIYCYSSTNDGIDSNGTLSISGGVIVSCGSTVPEESFDCDNNQFKITGGIMVGLGGATSKPTSNICTQRSLIYNTGGSGISAIHIKSASGETEVLTLKLPRTYSSQLCLLFSSPDMAASTGYTIYTGGSISGGTNFHGLYTGAAYTKGTSAATFTTTNMVTTVGASSGPGGNPGGGPGRS